MGLGQGLDPGGEIPIDLVGPPPYLRRGSIDLSDPRQGTPAAARVRIRISSIACRAVERR